MTALILFASTFVTVFALGFQSLNVNGGHYWPAFLTSFAIGAGNFALLKIVPGDTTPLQLAAYFAGGPIGIVASMWLHRRTVGRRRRLRDPDLTITVTADVSQAIKTLRAAADGLKDISNVTAIAAQKLENSNINCGADRP